MHKKSPGEDTGAFLYMAHTVHGSAGETFAGNPTNDPHVNGFLLDVYVARNLGHG